MIALTLALAAAPAPGAQDDQATLTRTPVELNLTSGGTVTVERARLRVPIVRAQPDSKPIEIDVWRFPAEAGAPEGVPPVFRLYGGPGWPGMEPAAIDYEGDIQPLTRVTDLVIVGQRGIGTSTGTPCASVPIPEGIERTQEREAELMISACTQCRQHWEAQGYDLKGLNVVEAARDVDDVRRLFGYEEIQLWGGSFGSHWGMTILRYHPEIVARALLTGMEGPDHTYDMPSGVLASLERLAAEAEEDESLQEYLPEDGLIEAFKLVIEDAEREPIEVEVEVDGEWVPVVLDAAAIRDMALGYTSSTSSRRGAATWPADLIALYNGDFERAARSQLPETRMGLPTASFFMLDCGSGISPERAQILIDDPAAKVVGDLGWFYRTACSAWDSDLGEDFRADFRTEIPTLIVHGTWDTSTPFDNALELLPMFANGHFVVVEGGSHGALGEAIGYSDEFEAAVMAFVTTGSTEALPDTVRMPPMQWATPRSQ